MPVFLVGVGILCGVIQDWVAFAVVLGLTGLNALVTVYEEQQSEKASELEESTAAQEQEVLAMRADIEKDLAAAEPALFAAAAALDSLNVKDIGDA